MTENDCLHNRLNENNDETVDSDLSDWFRIRDRDWQSFYSILKESNWLNWSDWLNWSELSTDWNKIYVKNIRWFNKELEFFLKWWMILMKLLLVSDQLIK